MVCTTDLIAALEEKKILKDVYIFLVLVTDNKTHILLQLNYLNGKFNL